MKRMLTATLTACILGLVFAAPADAQSLPFLRITSEEGAVYARRSVVGQAPIARWPAGTLIEALDKVDDWYWVMLPPDPHGTRRAGWMKTDSVELVASPPPGDGTRALTGEVFEAETALKGPELANKRTEAEAKAAAARLKRTERALEEARREYEELIKTDSTGEKSTREELAGEPPPNEELTKEGDPPAAPPTF